MSVVGEAITLNQVRAALALPAFDAFTAQRRMSPHAMRARPADDALLKQAAVLALLFPEDPAQPEARLRVVLTRRTEALRGHSGQVSFPGGRRDDDDDSFAATALRETCEELGLCADPIALLGALTPLYVPPTHYFVHPQVGYLPYPPHVTPNPDEVAAAFSAPLTDLLDDARKCEQERVVTGGARLRVPYYDLAGHVVWGATATMLSELEGRLRAVLDGA